MQALKFKQSTWSYEQVTTNLFLLKYAVNTQWGKFCHISVNISTQSYTTTIKRESDFDILSKHFPFVAYSPYSVEKSSSNILEALCEKGGNESINLNLCFLP